MGKQPDFTSVFQSELMYRGFRLTKDQVNDIAKAFVDSIYDNYRDGVETKLTRLGTFKFKKSGNYKRHHPETGELVDCESCSKVKFVPSKTLKAWVKQCDPANTKNE